MAVTGTGNPPISPNFGAPRFSSNDPSDVPTHLNAVTDTFDSQAAKRGAISTADIAPLAGILKTQLAPLALVDADVAAGAAIAKTKLAPLAIVDADIVAGAAIAESKVALATDAAANVGSRRTLGPGAQQAAAGNDPRFMGVVPVGTITPYAGFGDPPEAGWVVADGRLIDRTVYAAFYGRSGHAYNGGVDPGNNMVRIPDKRGKKSVGAINMGTSAGAGVNDNSHFQAVRGTSYGEVVHALLAGESGVNGNGGTGFMSNDHVHSGTTLGDYPDHAHQTTAGGSGAFNNIAGNFTAKGVGHDNTGGALARHQHDFSTGGVSSNHSHLLAARNADAAHNNIDPCEADSYIVRIA